MSHEDRHRNKKGTHTLVRRLLPFLILLLALTTTTIILVTNSIATDLVFDGSQKIDRYPNYAHDKQRKYNNNNNNGQGHKVDRRATVMRAESEPPVTSFVNPYDVGYLLSLVQSSTPLDAGLAIPLNVGVAYYRPKGREKVRCNKKRSSPNDETRRDARRRIMAYRSLPHTTCLAALLLRHYKDVAEALEADFSNAQNHQKQWDMKLPHDVVLPGERDNERRPFSFVPNTTETIQRITRLFERPDKKDRQRPSFDTLSECRKVAGILPGSSRHPRDATFFDVANVYYAGGRFVLFVHNNSDSDLGAAGPSPQLVPPLSSMMLQQERLTEDEAAEAMQQSVMPAAKAAAVTPQLLTKVKLCFGTMFPFVKNSWPQQTRDTLPLFIVSVQKVQGFDDTNSNKWGDTEQYGVGYYQPPTDFQVPHHTLVETVMTSFLSQQHFLRSRTAYEEEVERLRQQSGYALVLTSRPYYTTSGPFSLHGCHLAFERCLTSSPWGGMYLGQLQQFAVALKKKQQQQECNGEPAEVQRNRDMKEPLEFQYFRNDTLNQHHWVYGIRANETQFGYIMDEKRSKTSEKKPFLHYVVNVSEFPAMTSNFYPSKAGDGSLFYLKNLLVGYPTHCEPLLGQDPFYADMVHTLFRRFMPNNKYVSYEELLEALLAQKDIETKVDKPSLLVWKQWLALFYVSYKDCQAHLAQFRKLHLTKALVDFLREEGRLIDSNSISRTNAAIKTEEPLVSFPLEEGGGSGGRSNFYHHLSLKATGKSVSVDATTSDRNTVSGVLEFSSVFRLFFTPLVTEISAEARNQVKDRTSKNADDDVLIFYSSRHGDWARDVINEQKMLPRLPLDVAALLHERANAHGGNGHETRKQWQPRRVHLRIEHFNSTLSHGRQLFEQMEAHRTTIFIGAPGANLLNSLLLRPTAGVITLSTRPTINRVFYPTSVFPRYEESCSNSSVESCAWGASGLMWRSVALQQACNRKISGARLCRWGTDNTNNLILGDDEYRRLVIAVVSIVEAQDRLRLGT
ncbi:hypothetical protein DQ04_00241060 [Trypanosoma grayi]|uniref:hypothetical protein n=1 Tax=Trypanosoma grayi TaxID=71804 RepID=UPI0004F42FD6|nr:hypothetical protein DQ04_00241060 [Trypanosoma grayi]KEG14964.1 hypothetical protein DQ04_00241060 [Trypanosoma grayi]